MASLNNQVIFDNVKEEADAIRKQIEGAKFYGILVSEYPNQVDVELVIAYHLMYIKDVAERVTMPEAKPTHPEYPSFVDAGGEY